LIDPKDVIKNKSVEQLGVTAENYFKCRTDQIPLMLKPFSSPTETPAILQNMSLLLSGLHLGKSMTVLDFAAGTCWFSRYLNQMQCCTISCDISRTALEIGKRLFREFPIIGNPITAPIFLHFDGHKIDLPDEAVDRIICFDGFHHVPNQDEVLSELARVLKKGGIAGFNEPGRNHSQGPQAQREMENYAVLENDIDIAEIFAMAKNHGFTDLKLKTLSDLEVSLDQYNTLIDSRITNSGLHEIIINNVINMLEGTKTFFLYKGEFVSDSRSHIGLSHDIYIDNNIYYCKVGESLDITLVISNTGSATWLGSNIFDLGVVKIGTHLYDANDNLINLDFSRHPIPHNIVAGEKFGQTLKIIMYNSGLYKLSIDLVSEGVCWFENNASKPQTISINVRS
jgi:ubiquinone/menaquinone biosynthesis C-methylase UbiE